MKDFQNVLRGALVTGLSGVVVVATLTGCGMWEGKKARETGRTVTQYQSDKRTSDRVATALKEAPVYKYPDVHVDTYAGNVQLSGFVHTNGQKEQADKIARQVPGVNQVIDNLAIAPENPTPTGQSQGYPQNNQNAQGNQSSNNQFQNSQQQNQSNQPSFPANEQTNQPPANQTAPSQQ